MGRDAGGAAARRALAACVACAACAAWVACGGGGATDAGDAGTDVAADAADAPSDPAADGSADGADTPADGAGDVPFPPGPPRFRVLDYNVLCDGCDGAYAPWAERLEAFRDIIARADPDLMGLQEIFFAEQVDEVAALADRPFAALFFPGDDEGWYLPNPDTTILYRTDRFALVEHALYWLSPTPDVPWSVGFAEGQVIPRQVHWARLHDRASGQDIVFVDTHFDANNPAQANSAPLVLERTAPLAARWPVIFVGDFNSEPGTEAYRRLTQGVPPDAFHFDDAAALAPALRKVGNTEPLPDWSREAAIDHVFLAGPAGGAGTWTVTDWSVDLSMYGDPARFPSDHWPVVAEVELKGR